MNTFPNISAIHIQDNFKIDRDRHKHYCLKQLNTMFLFLLEVPIYLKVITYSNKNVITFIFFNNHYNSQIMRFLMKKKYFFIPEIL